MPEPPIRLPSLSLRLKRSEPVLVEEAIDAPAPAPAPAAAPREDVECTTSPPPPPPPPMKGSGLGVVRSCTNTQWTDRASSLLSISGVYDTQSFTLTNVAAAAVAAGNAREDTRDKGLVAPIPGSACDECTTFRAQRANSSEGRSYSG